VAVQEWLQKRAELQNNFETCATMGQTYQLARIMLKKIILA
jgi:hypothetical protein